MIKYQLLFALIVSLCLSGTVVAISNHDELIWDIWNNEEGEPFDNNQISCSSIEDLNTRELCYRNSGEVQSKEVGSFSLEKRKIKTSNVVHDIYNEAPISIQLEPGSRINYRYLINMSDPAAQQFYEVMVFITGNLCNFPQGLSDPNSYLSLYTAFNDTGIFTNSSDSPFYSQTYNQKDFQYGYLQSLSDTNVKTNESFYLNIVLEADEIEDINGTFTIQLGLSQDDLIYQWDNRTWINLVDTDDTTALFMTGNLTTAYNNATDILDSSSNYYTVHIFLDEDDNYFSNLNRSWCSIVNGNELVKQTNISYSFTQRGGGLKEQMYVKGLQPSTDYIAYATQDFSSTQHGGVVFNRLQFSTQEPDTCKLVFNLTFCDNVAYSVPRSNNVQLDSNFQELADLYDSNVKDMFGNFSKALQQIPCQAEDDQRYSPIVTCDDCATSYKNWLCAVSIPRCTTNNETEYKYRELNESRNDYINSKVDPPSPYYEILPCLSMCHAIVRDCPTDFGFACPRDNTSIGKSYWFMSDDSTYDTCNYVGALSTSGALPTIGMNRIGLFISFMVVSLVMF